MPVIGGSAPTRVVLVVVVAVVDMSRTYGGGSGQLSQKEKFVYNNTIPSSLEKQILLRRWLYCFVGSLKKSKRRLEDAQVHESRESAVNPGPFQPHVRLLLSNVRLTSRSQMAILNACATRSPPRTTAAQLTNGVKPSFNLHTSSPWML